MKFIVTTLLLIFISLFCIAQQTKVSLNQCIELAFKQSFELKNQDSKIKLSENTLSQSRKAIFPSANASFSQGLSSGRNIDPFTNDFIQQTNSSNSWGANSNLVLFNGFSLKNTIKQNQLNVKIDNLEIQKLKRELKNTVILAYMQVLMNQELLKVTQDQENNIKGQLERIKDLVSEGQMPKTNIIDTDAQLATAEFEINNAKNNLELSKLTIAQLIGLENYSSLILEPIKISEVPINNNFVKDIFNSLNLYPEIKSNLLKQQATKIEIDIAKAQKYPNISLNAGLGSAYSSAASKEFNYFKQLDFNFNQYARLNVSIPIYDNGQISARKNAAQLNHKIVETQSEQIKISLRQEIEKAALAQKIAFEKLTSAKRQINALKIAYDSAQERFNEGLINSMDLNTFRLNLEKANSTLIQAKYEYHFKKMLLENYNLN
jgi:outer membrane protein